MMAPLIHRHGKSTCVFKWDDVNLQGKQAVSSPSADVSCSDIDRCGIQEDLSSSSAQKCLRVPSEELPLPMRLLVGGAELGEALVGSCVVGKEGALVGSVLLDEGAEGRVRQEDVVGDELQELGVAGALLGLEQHCEVAVVEDEPLLGPALAALGAGAVLGELCAVHLHRTSLDEQTGGNEDSAIHHNVQGLHYPMALLPLLLPLCCRYLLPSPSGTVHYTISLVSVHLLGFNTERSE